MTVLGDKLAAARAHQGWSLREAGKRTGISNAHLSQLETGTIAHPELGTLLPLAAAYGIPVDELATLAGYDVTAIRELSGEGVRVSVLTDPVVLDRHDLRVLLAVSREYLNAFTPDREPLPEGYEYRDVKGVVAKCGTR